MRHWAIVLAIFTFISLRYGSASASAAEAYTTSSTWLRTGPDYSFPSIERIPRGALVDVIGCTDSYNWCDVDYEGERGWFAGNRLQFVYNGRRGSAVDLAPLLGLMILQFSFGNYWNDHYRDRPWFNERNQRRWQNWQPPQHPFGNRPRQPGAPALLPHAPEKPRAPQTAPIAPNVQPPAAPPSVETPVNPAPIRPAPINPAPIRPVPNTRPNPINPAPDFQRPAPQQQKPFNPALPQGGTHKKRCIPPEICP